MMHGKDGDALMRQLAESIEKMGAAPTEAAPKPPSGFATLADQLKAGKAATGTEKAQIIGKAIGLLTIVVGVPFLRGWAFKTVWNEIRETWWGTGTSFNPRQLDFKSGLALSFALRVLVKSLPLPKGK